MIGDFGMELHCARVYLTEAARRRSDTRFHATLLQWAANARRRAAEARPQRDLFGANVVDQERERAA